MHTIQLILNKIKETNLNISKIAKETGIPKERFYKWVKGENMPKAIDADKLRHWASENLEKDTNEGGLPVIEDPPEKYVNDKNTLPASMLNLTESNRSLAEANKIMVETNRKLIEKLINFIKNEK